MVGSWLALVLTTSAATRASAPVDEGRQLELNREARAQQEAGDLLAAADTWIEALALAVTDLDVQNHFCGAIGALDRGLDEGGDREAIGARVDANRDALEASAARLRRVDAVDNEICLAQWEGLAEAFPAAVEEIEAPVEETPEVSEPPPVEPSRPTTDDRRLRIGLIAAGAVTVSGAAAALATGFGAAHDPSGGFQGFAYRRVYDAAPPELRDSGAELCEGATGEVADACSGYTHTRRAFIATATITGLGAVATGVFAALLLRRGRSLGSQRAGLRIAPGVGGASLSLSF
ncbi:MAG: hypothetical protein KC486_19205 [Myxococcales bacterium]|nr:hypothetical protein [Myxococcales bacterium]